MNLAVSPQTQTISITWQDYLSGNYDRSLIPWPRYRYSGMGVVQVSPEWTRNIKIGKRIARLLEDTDSGVVAYTNSISVEVERSQKEERIPHVLVISKECDLLLDDAPGIVTLDMPAPILVIEVVSPSSVKADLEEKPFEMMGRGVDEYVSIDWRKETVQVWSCTEDGKNYNFSEYRTDDRVILNSFPTLAMTVDEMILKR